MTGERDFSNIKILILKVHSPSLYMSASNKYPDGYSDDDINCGILGVEVCSIPQSKINSNTTYYLGIFCWSNCNLEFKINYYSEKFLKLGDIYYYEFKEG